MQPARQGEATVRAASRKPRKMADGGEGDHSAGGKLAALVELEGNLRKLPDRRAVEMFAVNELRRLVNFSQAAFVRFDARGRARVSALSGLAQVNREAPLVRSLERVAQGLLQTAPDEGVARGVLDELSVAREGELREWPFRHHLWVVFRERNGRPFGGLLFMSAQPWRAADEIIAARLGEAVAHAIMALQPPQLLRRPRLPRKVVLPVLALVALLMLLPVPMTAVAPVEVVADAPFIVAAPMDGVVARVEVEPNTPVKAGQVLFRYDDTRLRAEAEIAAQREAVALARLMTLRKAAFSDGRARQQLAEARTELELARAEHAYARRQLERVLVRAGHDGVVIFSDRERWIGKPVRTGEKIMEIADPRRVVFRVDLPVEDGIALKEGGRVRVFLDADPLNAVEGRVRWASFHAEEVAGGLLAYRVMAAPAKGDDDNRLRIGFRGSAQVFGEKVPLAFYLFRRPIAALRQFLGV